MSYMFVQHVFPEEFQKNLDCEISMTYFPGTKSFSPIRSRTFGSTDVVVLEVVLVVPQRAVVISCEAILTKFSDLWEPTL